MEARAGYVAVGAFVLAVLGGILVATLWLARVQFETQYQYFETHVAGPVSGLGSGALVRLNGIEVGRVARIGLDPKDPRLVTLLLQVRDTIEIHADSVASIETQGLTGVSYVEISGGTLGSPVLTTAAGQAYPQIASRPSSLQQVFDNAPELVSRLMVIADRVEAVLDDKNRAVIAQTLDNIRDTTAVFDRRSKDIDQLIVDSGVTMHNLADASATLKDSLANLDRTSGNADRLIATANTTFEHATRLASDLDAVVQASRPGLRDLTTNATAQLDELLSDARRLLASLNRVSTGLERDPSRLLLGDRHQGYQPK
ncbi:MAG TPA: MlaD family protein [Acetobacteraceae bacterium]|jgi:phospholipid/cholesterol/gamma-HCH transport system substrate-binding protein